MRKKKQASLKNFESWEWTQWISDEDCTSEIRGKFVISSAWHLLASSAVASSRWQYEVGGVRDWGEGGSLGRSRKIMTQLRFTTTWIEVWAVRRLGDRGEPYALELKVFLCTEKLPYNMPANMKGKIQQKNNTLTSQMTSWKFILKVQNFGSSLYPMGMSITTIFFFTLSN